MLATMNRADDRTDQLTARMRRIQMRDPGRRGIRRIIQETFAETNSFEATAQRLDISKGLLSMWIRQLGGALVTEKHVEFRQTDGEGE